MRAGAVKIGVLVSGNGSNFQAILDAIESGRIQEGKIACLISNKPDAYAIERARRHNIPSIVLEYKNFTDRSSYDQALVNLLKENDVKLVVLAGFMRLLSPIMVNAFPNAIMNIHPALLPAFPGLDAQKQALEYGVRYTGCTVHFVDCGTDTGPVILQAVVPILEGDTEETLSERIHGEEHRIYPEAVALFCAGRIKIEGRKVHIRTKPDNP